MNGVYGYIIRLINKERKLFVIINLIGNINEYLFFERLLCVKKCGLNDKTALKRLNVLWF